MCDKLQGPLLWSNDIVVSDSKLRNIDIYLQ